jgi:hypothetical protein
MRPGPPPPRTGWESGRGVAVVGEVGVGGAFVRGVVVGGAFVGGEVVGGAVVGGMVVGGAVVGVGVGVGSVSSPTPARDGKSMTFCPSSAPFMNAVQILTG